MGGMEMNNWPELPPNQDYLWEDSETGQRMLWLDVHNPRRGTTPKSSLKALYALDVSVSRGRRLIAAGVAFLFWSFESERLAQVWRDSARNHAAELEAARDKVRADQKAQEWLVWATQQAASQDPSA